MTYKLLIDDVRNPPKDNGVVESGWRIARTVDQAINIVMCHGMPNHIAFDHDLGESDNGMDFAKWLGEYCLYYKQRPDFTFDVHSMNPIGKDNIKSYIENLKRFYDEEYGSPCTSST